MISATNFSSVTAFCFLVAAMVLQCMWSLSVATIEGYALLLGRSLRDSPLLSLFAVGDWVTAVITFAGACASAGIAVLVGRDVHQGCNTNYCGRSDKDPKTETIEGLKEVGKEAATAGNRDVRVELVLLVGASGFSWFLRQVKCVGRIFYGMDDGPALLLMVNVGFRILGRGAGQVSAGFGGCRDGADSMKGIRLEAAGASHVLLTGVEADHDVFEDDLEHGGLLIDSGGGLVCGRDGCGFWDGGGGCSLKPLLF